MVASFWTHRMARRGSGVAPTASGGSSGRTKSAVDAVHRASPSAVPTPRMWNRLIETEQLEPDRNSGGNLDCTAQPIPDPGGRGPRGPKLRPPVFLSWNTLYDS